MKIALCLEYPIAQAGGVSVLVLTLIKELAAEHEIVLVSPDDPVGLSQARLADLIRGHIFWSPAGASSEAAVRLATEISAAGVQLAHFHFGGNFGWSNRWPSRCPIPRVARLGIPVVTTIHMAVGLLHGYCGPQKPVVVKLALLPFAWINKLRVLRYVRREITVSQQDYERLRRWYWPARSKFTAIYHSRIRETVADALIHPPRRQSIILGVGHIAQRKGQAVLAAAFSQIAVRHPDWKLQLAGHIAEESARQEIERQQAVAGSGRIELLGQCTDTAGLMSQAAIYVQPSFHEGLPLSLQEALWHGCACLATKIPGNVELVTHEQNGLLVPAGDITAMAQALERLIKDVGLRKNLSKDSHATIRGKGMTITQMTQNHLYLYACILKKA